ncbi:MarR family winged helix-turn-helix transcriptional regulator [Bryocella elongata]|uniref:MarR family winged helix-turn-helix transcriptional regulator n=1 Tax=Bryocella elongata TaxID=863522 RepID=UPI001359DE74|nr:helix-turn-helix domain-containing protein [Bryocella elongata]
MSAKKDHPSIPPDVKELAEFRFLLRRFLAFSEQAAESNGLPAQQHQLLLQVAGAPEGTDVTPTYLATRLALRRHSVVELCNRCESAGLLRRIASEEDLRSVSLHLTSQGEEILTKLSQAHAAELRERVPDLVDSLRRLLAMEGDR